MIKSDYEFYNRTTVIKDEYYIHIDTYKECINFAVIPRDAKGYSIMDGRKDKTYLWEEFMDLLGVGKNDVLEGL